jgi:hypothetical protein
MTSIPHPPPLAQQPSHCTCSIPCYISAQRLFVSTRRVPAEYPRPRATMCNNRWGADAGISCPSYGKFRVFRGTFCVNIRCALEAGTWEIDEAVRNYSDWG